MHQQILVYWANLVFSCLLRTPKLKFGNNIEKKCLVKLVWSLKVYNFVNFVNKLFGLSLYWRVEVLFLSFKESFKVIIPVIYLIKKLYEYQPRLSQNISFHVLYFSLQEPDGRLGMQNSVCMLQLLSESISFALFFNTCLSLLSLSSS